MQEEEHDFTALSFVAEDQNALFSDIDDWLDVTLITGWHYVEFVSIVFTENGDSHQAVMTCKVSQNPEAFGIDDEDNDQNQSQTQIKKSIDESMDDLPF